MEQKNQISLVNAILKGMNIMVGAAILAAPQIITTAAGDMGIFAWGVSLVILPIVLSIMRLTQLVENDGGIYAYAQKALGRSVGFLSGSMYYLGYTFAATAVISFLRALLLTAFPETFLIQNIFAFYGIAMALIATLNLVSIRVMNSFETPAILLKFAPLFIVIGAIPFASGSDFVFDLSKLGNLPSALTTAIFGFLGFEYSLALNQYLSNKEVNGPRAVVGTFLSTTVLYVLFHFGLLKLMGSQNLATLGATGFASFLPLSSITIKLWVAMLLGFAIKLSYFSSANGMTFGNITTLYGLAKDKLIRGGEILTITNQNDRPLFAGILQFITIYALGTLVPNILVLANLTNLTVLLVFVLLITSLIAVLNKQVAPSLSDKLIAFFGFISSVGLATYSFLSLGTSWSVRMNSVLPLVGCVLLSFIVYKPEE
ncbi:APC family permease [Candidatus Dependentiae bacterium]|nr:APC family permease [Candidatus Dependentiae bacterium]